MDHISGVAEAGDSPQWSLFSVPLFTGDKAEVLQIISKQIDKGVKRYRIATVNPEFIMLSARDKIFFRLLQGTSLNVIDGIGLIWAYELYRQCGTATSGFFRKLFCGIKIGVKAMRGSYRERLVSGSDLIVDLSKMAAEKKLKVFYLGGFEDRAEKTAEYFRLRFGLAPEQTGWCAGTPEFTDDEAIERINRFQPDILFVAYSMRKQEYWITDYLERLDTGVVVGVGRSFDYYSGNLKRAPQAWRKMGMEWLYSLLKEPKRWRRQLQLPKFIWRVLWGK